MPTLLLLFIVVPILEMWLLITVGREIGALPTIGLVLLTAVVGLALLRRQGLSTILRAQQKMQVGELPAREMAEGIFLAVGGALLLTPGFFTDALGFACLIPGLRQLVLGRLLRHVVVVRGPGYPPGGQYGPRRGPGRESDSDIIEGEYSHEDRNRVRDSRDRDRPDDH
ncbi:FxsA family protein [Microbulbifer guangxiensis]|uniref:FxsA family protein n=1 Tax=Microbulbifer guangxiensis TaxID=2904249 RepID=UPI001F1A83CC|nr:FxsA family protein [Microbulbifer guangxiensis]